MGKDSLNKFAHTLSEEKDEDGRRRPPFLALRMARKQKQGSCHVSSLARLVAILLATGSSPQLGRRIGRTPSGSRRGDPQEERQLKPKL